MAGQFDRSSVLSQGKSPATWIYFILVTAVYFFELLFRTHELSRWLVFTTGDGVFNGQIWRFFTAQFVHLHLLQILSVGLMLFFCGRMLESILGYKKYLTLLLLAGCSGPLLYSILSVTKMISPVFGIQFVHGATGASFAVLTTLYMLCGNQMAQFLFIPKPMKLKHIILIFGGVWFLSLMFNKNDQSAAAQASHIAGVGVACLFVKFGLRKRAKPFVSKSQKAKKSYKPKVKPRTALDISDTEVDKILDKISAEGFQSLTDQERKILDKASKK